MVTIIAAAPSQLRISVFIKLIQAPPLAQFKVRSVLGGREFFVFGSEAFSGG